MPNTFIIDDSIVDEPSAIPISTSKMEELSLFAGDTVILKGNISLYYIILLLRYTIIIITVILKGKKRKDAVAVITVDESLSDNRVRIPKILRSNLR